MTRHLKWDEAASLGYIKYLLDGARGVYLPQDFAQCFDLQEWGLDPNSEDVETLEAGPDHEWYWESWDAVLDAAEHTDAQGCKWMLWQDADLFAICVRDEHGNDLEIED